MDQVQAAIGKATGGQGGDDLKDAAAKGLEGVKAQVTEGLTGSGGGDASGAAAGEADKAGVDTDKLQAAAMAYAKGEGDVDDIKTAATETATSFAKGLMK